MRNFKIKYQLSKEVFILFCALNALDYDDENNKKGMHPIRKKIRKILLKYNYHNKYPLLKKIIKTHHQWYLLRAILTKSKNIKKTFTLDNFTSNLKKFSNEPPMQKLWKISKTRQIKESKKIAPLFKKETRKLMAFINSSQKNLKKIVLITTPLDAYWRGYGLRMGKIGYIVVGPGADKNHCELIRHELLHLLAPAFRIPRRITTGKHHKRLTTIGYASPNDINREYIIRSLNLLYESAVLKMDISKAIKREQKNFPNIKEVLAFVKEEKEKGRL
ncbi:MAG: hypothetical protein NTV77_00645 [Candidatus Azambacteria bacterium]|nr:hypothetical protein [Candidatus Azambacteria bacterium]